MAGVQTTDTAGEIEKHIAIDVDKTRPFATFEEEAVLRLGDTGRHETPALLEKGAAARSRQWRTNADRLTAFHASSLRHAHYHFRSE